MATYIGVNAVVASTATVSGNAKIGDNAEICNNAKIGGDAKICGGAVICDNAVIGGNAMICGNTRICGDGIIQSTRDYLHIGPLGEHNRFLTAHKDSKIGIRVNTGCFTGSISEFITAVTNKYGEGSELGEEYLSIVPIIEARLKS